MMRTLSLAGAWYAAALPNGEHAELYRDVRIGTSRGDVTLPIGDQPLFLDSGVIDGALCVAGQSHAGNGLLLWDGAKWRTPGVIAFGETPVVFGVDDEVLSAVSGDAIAHYRVRSGVLYYTAAALGVDGLRAVLEDGTIIRGNNTRADPARVIGEFTTWGDVTVGQSGFSCVALHGGKRYVLVTGAQPGGCRAIRLKRQGDQLAVAVHLPDGVDGDPKRAQCTLLIWCTVAELAQFPEQHLTTETPMALMAPNEIGAVQRAMSEHPEIDTKNEATRGRVLDYACSYLGGRPWGRKRKGDGSLNTDAMAYLRPDGDVEYYDAIDGTTGAATWGGGPGAGPFKPGQNGNWIEALPINQPGGGPGPTPPNVHMYDGGEHDTNECDICHLSRFDPVHVIPESLVQHSYNGGEQDTGLCDICQKPVGDPIHATAPAPQEPPGGTGNAGGTVSLGDDVAHLLGQVLDSYHAIEVRLGEITGAIQELNGSLAGAGKNLGGELIKAAPAILGVLLPLLRQTPKPAAKRKRR